ncbi:3-phosphoshikimate 1-carboxyvinyltransferase [Halocynthiibacter sp. C4]|uniref:3-phosphoshikimate 1-carboxyvinyltransferase n=1 Tax=Halocynthiibacter sp. C4 TaxID=2992758 RepID=UPI00237C2572|nr:3-phosphoshikimate 1-carboxyvinyltransferase [Halocynthiibacter sp. C4]MDE0590607.1 3-phosphoshikimate 1-carboxyvinyltransferase [Halocynthiibacter sp. C4]
MTNPKSPATLHLSVENQTLEGVAQVPGSKSITNRALLLAALSKGETTLSGCLVSHDTLLMAEALRQFGVEVSEVNPESVTVKSDGTLKPPAAPIFVGNAGTTARFLTAAACLADGTTVIDGDEDMQRRPIQPLITALNELGFTAESATGCPPVTVTGGAKEIAAKVGVDAGLSTQYISALMMMAPKLANGLRIELKNAGSLDGAGYLDVTTRIMAEFGVNVAEEGAGWNVPDGVYASPTYAVEPDYSACTYFWAADALSAKTITIGNSKEGETAQPDAKALDVIRMFPNMPAIVDGSQMQDAIPTLAVLAAFNETPVRFVGLKNLRVKECDRVEALREGLVRINANLATVDGDDLLVNGSPYLVSDNPTTQIRTFNDHRIAMCFALAAIRIDGIIIENPDCVQKTFPNYWDEMAKVGMVSELTD